MSIETAGSTETYTDVDEAWEVLHEGGIWRTDRESVSAAAAWASTVGQLEFMRSHWPVGEPWEEVRLIGVRRRVRTATTTTVTEYGDLKPGGML